MAEVNQCAPGLYALQSDYTALERKCQELEREHAGLGERYDQLTTAYGESCERLASLEREVERLRKIEAAANGMINAGLVDISAAEDAYTALAAALGDGRKG